jgi:DNA-binding transcriptional regulator YdaS (Cro superfamily)
LTLIEYFEATGDSQRELARRCGLHESRMSVLKKPGGFPASLDQAMAILRETGGHVTPNDFIPSDAWPKRRARVVRPQARGR